MNVTFSKILTRGVGVAAIYLAGRDAHVYGKIKADEHMKTKNADAAAHYMTNTLIADKPSINQGKMRDAVFQYELDNGFRGFVNQGIGYFQGFFSMLISNIVPFGLGLAALFAKGKFGFGVAKASAIGAVGVGIYSFLKNGLGLGKPKDLNFPTQ